MKCPKCNFVQGDKHSECQRCGVIFSKVTDNDTRPTPAEAIETSPARPMWAIPLVAIALGIAVAQFGWNSAPRDGVIGYEEAKKIEAKAHGWEEPNDKQEDLPLDPNARANYETAKQAVIGNDLDKAIDYYSRAIDDEPDFLEAYYNRGSAQMRLALDAATRDDRATALEHFRSGVKDKQRSKELMSEGRWFIYKSEQDQAEVRFHVDEGLQDIDQILADEDFAFRALLCFLGDCRGKGE